MSKPPHIQTAIAVCGCDPRRFLDRKLLTGQDGALHPGERIQAMIRGMDRKERVNAWMAVEEWLDRGPRDKVMLMLQDRWEFLDEHGERPDLSETPPADRPARFQHRDGRDIPEKQVFVVRDGERIPYEDRPTPAGSTSHPFDWGPNCGGESA